MLLKPKMRKPKNPIPRKTIRTIKKQIKKTPHISKLEMAWYKKPRKAMISGLFDQWSRENERVLSRNPETGETMHIHTHPHSENPRGLPKALPSPSDAFFFFDKMLTTPAIRTSVISIINSQGKEIGRTFFRLPKSKMGNQNIERIRKELESILRNLARFGGGLDKHDVFNFLKSHGFKFRFVPAKGHKFNSKSLEYEKQ